MTTSKSLSHGHVKLNLLGAHDKDIGQVKPNTKVPKAIRLSLTKDVVLELQKQTKVGKGTIQLLLGKTPQLRYGPKTTPIILAPAKFRSELYERDGEHLDDWHFKTLISHTAIMDKAEKAAQQADAALAQFQATMESLRKEKEENKATFIDGVQDPSKTAKVKPSQAIIRQAMQNSTGTTHRPSSPVATVSSLHTPSLSATSNPLAPKPDPEADSIRYALLHLLAIEPLEGREVVTGAKLKIEPSKKALLKLTKDGVIEESLEGKKAGSKDRTWKVSNKGYKEVKPWDFKYKSDEERQKVIDNAIRAFDRQRISRDDKVWQQLLPKEERGKGKCLSKLNLHNGPISTKPTPLPKAADSANNLKPATSPLPVTKKTSTSASKKKVVSSDQARAPSASDSPKVSAQTGQKRKLESSKFKSAERIENSDEDEDEDEGEVKGSWEERKLHKKPRIEEKQAPAKVVVKKSNPPRNIFGSPATSAITKTVPVQKSKLADTESKRPAGSSKRLPADTVSGTAAARATTPIAAKSAAPSKTQPSTTQSTKAVPSTTTNKPKPLGASSLPHARKIRAESTASSSISSLSDKSTPMHRQSSSQSSISVRPSEMPSARKRPATSFGDNPAPAKRARADTLASQASPPNISSPLSDINSVSTASDATSSSHATSDGLTKQGFRHSKTALVADAELSPQLKELEKLRAEFRDQFLHRLHLRIKIEVADNIEREELKKEHVLLEDKIDVTRRSIRQLSIDMAEEEYSALVPKHLELDGESRTYLVKKLRETQESYNKMHEALEFQEHKPVGELKALQAMYNAAQQLRQILAVE